MAPRGWPGIWQCLPPRCKEWGSGGQPSKQGFGEWLEQQLEDSWENTWVLIWTTRRAKKKGKTRGLKEMERQSWDQERQLWTTVFVEFSAAEQEQAGLFKVGSWGRATARAPFFFFLPNPGRLEQPSSYPPEEPAGGEVKGGRRGLQKLGRQSGQLLWY